MHQQQMIDVQDLKLVVECHLSSVKAGQALHPLEFFCDSPGLAGLWQKWILKSNKNTKMLSLKGTLLKKRPQS